jgi:predicted nucleic acid-binding protein
MIVVDASVATNMLLYSDQRGKRARATLARDVEWVAPEHWKAEIFSAIRGLWLGRQVSQEQAHRAIARLPRLGVETVAIDDLLPRMWNMRDVVSGYDAPYVVLAEARALTLVTADGRLARAATARCRVELVTEP